MSDTGLFASRLDYGATGIPRIMNLMEPMPKQPWAQSIAWGTTFGVGVILYIALLGSVFLPRTWLGAAIALVGIGGPLVAWRRIKFSSAESLGTSLCWGLAFSLVPFLVARAVVLPHPINNCVGVLSLLTFFSVPVILRLRAVTKGFAPWLTSVKFGLTLFAFTTLAFGWAHQSASAAEWLRDAEAALPMLILYTLMRRITPSSNRLGFRDSINVVIATWPGRSRKTPEPKAGPS